MNLSSNTTPAWPFVEGASLPGQVFGTPGQLGFLFTDGAALTAPDLWLVLRKLAERFGDGRIFIRVVEDRQRRGALPSGDFEIAQGPDELSDWLRHKDAERSEPLYVYARVAACWGSSVSWGLWFDQDWELTVLGVPGSELGVVREEMVRAVDWPWYDAGEVGKLLAPAFYPDPVPQALIRQIRESFGVVRL